MRVVLSRKGFDSAAGGCASPIFPDGRLLSLPIPYPASPTTYADISYDGERLGRIVEDLTGGAIAPGAFAHLDPDLSASALPRLPGWLPAFGQIDAALSHLDGQGVGPGDLFLFFGWFREVERADGRWRFRRGAPDRHVLFGWLQVREVLRTGDAGLDLGTRAWLARHPHVQLASPSNAIYIARETLELGLGTPSRLPGAGSFRTCSDASVLTEPGQPKRSRWRLPAWFYPDDKRRPLTYHANLAHWGRRGESVTLDAVPRGQEFVLHCDDYPEAAEWAERIIAAHA